MKQIYEFPTTFLFQKSGKFPPIPWHEFPPLGFWRILHFYVSMLRRGHDRKVSHILLYWFIHSYEKLNEYKINWSVFCRIPGIFCEYYPSSSLSPTIQSSTFTSFYFQVICSISPSSLPALSSLGWTWFHFFDGQLVQRLTCSNRIAAQTWVCYSITSTYLHVREIGWEIAAAIDSWPWSCIDQRDQEQGQDQKCCPACHRLFSFFLSSVFLGSGTVSLMPTLASTPVLFFPLELRCCIYFATAQGI